MLTRNRCFSPLSTSVNSPALVIRSTKGTMFATPTASTPGTDSSARRARSQYSLIRWSSAYTLGVRNTSARTVFLRSNPGPKSRDRNKFCTNSDPTASTTNDSATCAATNTLRPRIRRSRRMSALSDSRTACQAGITPLITVEKIASNAAYPATRQSGSILSRIGKGRGSGIDAIASAATSANTNPSAAPLIDSSRLSASNCCSSRPRLAPSDNRIAISCLRADDRASDSPATLMQAIVNTNPTSTSNATKNMTTVVAALLPLSRAKPSTGVTLTPSAYLRPRSGISLSIRSPSAANAPLAASIFMSGFRRKNNANSVVRFITGR